MQVVQPKPTRLKPSLSRSFCRPDLSRYSRDDLRAGRERRLHPRLRLQPLRSRLARKQAGRDHHARIRRVGAGRDRRDHDVAVAEVVLAAFDRRRACPFRRLCRIPCPSRREAGLHVLQQHAILRTLRAGDRGLDRAEIELEHVGERPDPASSWCGTCPAPSRRPSTSATRSALRAGLASGSRSSRRRPGRSRRSRRIPAPCCRSWRDLRSSDRRGRGRRTRRTCRPRRACAASA